MRSRPVQKFREIMDQYNLGDPKDVLVLGSDADEIAKGEAVWALSHCHIKNDPDLEQSIVYFGTLLGTGTLTALRYLGDGVCSADGQGPQELARAVWGAGPVVKTLSRVCLVPQGKWGMAGAGPWVRPPQPPLVWIDSDVGPWSQQHYGRGVCPLVYTQNAHDSRWSSNMTEKHV